MDSSTESQTRLLNTLKSQIIVIWMSRDSEHQESGHRILTQLSDFIRWMWTWPCVAPLLFPLSCHLIGQWLKRKPAISLSTFLAFFFFRNVLQLCQQQHFVRVVSLMEEFMWNALGFEENTKTACLMCFTQHNGYFTFIFTKVWKVKSTTCIAKQQEIPIQCVHTYTL